MALEAYLSGAERLPSHRPKRSRRYDQAPLTTIAMLDFTAGGGGAQTAQTPQPPVSPSYPTRPHVSTYNLTDGKAVKMIQTENPTRPHP